MYCSSITTSSYINIISIHVTNYTTNITYIKYFITLSLRTNNFCNYIAICIPCTCSHDVSTIIDGIFYSIFSTTCNSIRIAKIASYTTYIMCTTYITFFISNIFHISVHSFTNYTTYVTGNIICVSAISCFITLYISFICSIIYCTVS